MGITQKNNEHPTKGGREGGLHRALDLGEREGGMAAVGPGRVLQPATRGKKRKRKKNLSFFALSSSSQEHYSPQTFPSSPSLSPKPPIKK